MIESPLYREIVEESKREGGTEVMRRAILKVLVTRFGPPAKELEVELKAVDLDQFDDLVGYAAKCRNLASFHKRLVS
jgi:hypothetical protein